MHVALPVGLTFLTLTRRRKASDEKSEEDGGEQDHALRGMENA